MQGNAVVVVGNRTKALHTLHDESFKEVAHYTINAHHNYFHIADGGRMVVYGPHPLVTKSPIYKLYIARYQHTVIHYKMPTGGIMPPFATDETGRYIAAHMSEEDAVVVLNSLANTQVGCFLSERSLYDEQGIARYPFRWVLPHPATGTPYLFDIARTMLRDPLVVSVTKSTCVLEKDEPPFATYFRRTHPAQGTDSCVLHVAFVGKMLVTITREQDPDDIKRARAEAIYWDITSRHRKYVHIATSPKNIYVVGAARGSERLLMYHEGGYDHISPGRVRTRAIPQAQECDTAYLFMSPHGYWALLAQGTNDTRRRAHRVLPLTILYFGIEKMQGMAEDALTAGYRTFVMRLYALQRASELGEHISLPHALRQTLSSRTVPKSHSTITIM